MADPRIDVEELVGAEPDEAPPIELSVVVRLGSRSVRLCGRVHAVRRGERAALVERLHTRRRPEDRDALALACAVLEQSGTDVEQALLIYVSVRDGSAEEVDIHYDSDAARGLLATKLSERTDAADAEQLRAREAARHGETLEFPFAQTRESQSLLVRDLDDAAAAGLTLLCAAPTGTGKTVAALYPLLRRALRENRKLFFVTAKTSQQTLALETLARMIPSGSSACAVQIAAKDRICPTDRRRCRLHRCLYQDRFKSRLEESGLIDRLALEGVVDAETIAEQALVHDLCPFETSLALSLRATAIVADFNYVFDPHVYLRRFFDRPYDQHLLVVDEAHNLPARAVGYYSPVLELDRMRVAAGGCRAYGGLWTDVADLFDNVIEHCDGELARLEQERDAAPAYVEFPDREAFEGFGARASALIAECATVRDEPPQVFPASPAGTTSRRDPLYDLLVALRDFAAMTEEDPELFATMWSAERVHTRCLDPASYLRQRFQGFHASLCMSATLTPLEFFGRSLGVDGPNTVPLELPSPFPKERRCLVAVTSVDTTFKKRSEDAERIASIIDATVRLRRGNYLLFFSSFAYRDEVVAKLSGRRTRDYEVLLQLPGVPSGPFLRKLRENRDRTLLLCGVQGGVFGEGVDYPGDMAIGVFVVGPGLPTVSLEQELVREYYDRRLGAGFEYAYVLPGLSRAVQAGGRAIRSAEDRAFVMLLGRRFAEPLYRDAMPRYWREELRYTEDPIPLVREFWGNEVQVPEV